MAIVLGPNQYGKAEVRLVHVDRSSAGAQDQGRERHQPARSATSPRRTPTGDNSAVIATDTQKNTVYALARLHGVGAIEDFALRMARNFVDTYEQVTGARQAVEEYFWDRIVTADGTPHDHSFSKGSPEVRTTVVHQGRRRRDGDLGAATSSCSRRTGSEFWGFPDVEYTSLVETTDRIMATVVTARWRYVGTDVDWDKTYASVRSIMLDTFAAVHSLSLQQTLYAMGEAVLEAHPRSPRCACRCRTSTTSSSTCRSGASTTPTRSGTPPTGRTASSRPRSSVTTSRPPPRRGSA